MKKADDAVLELPPYGVGSKDKEALLLPILRDLTEHHRRRCKPYGRILGALGVNEIHSLRDVPFLPVRLFKNHELLSVERAEVVKTITSSGTTGQAVSRIHLDRRTSQNQTKALVRIMQSFLGKDRHPMIIVDTEAVVRDRRLFSARGAGILGLSTFGRNHLYALNEDMSLRVEEVLDFMARFGDRRIFIFGFTFMVWKYFYLQLKALNRPIRFRDAVLVHSGGWKSLQEESIGNERFKGALSGDLNITGIHNFYGMAEQVGSIYVECEEGFLHAPSFSDVLIRDARDWGVCPNKTKGIVEVLSVLPESYPGHALLTDDMGIVIGEDDCACGRMGKYFLIEGRIPVAEIRGCSDTHASEVLN